jgi:D-alanyl-D-alanine carboxypeptidase
MNVRFLLFNLSAGSYSYGIKRNQLMSHLTKKQIKEVLAGVILLLILYSCQKEEVVDQKKEILQRTLEENTSDKFPGLSLYAAINGKTYSLASGKMDLASGKTMTPQSLNYAQSISKTFTAVCILKLVEERKIGLDQKINIYLEAGIIDRIPNGNIITVRQLLNHTSGVYDFLNNPDFINDVLGGTAFPLTPDKLLGYIESQPASFVPGASFEYSNTNYDLLAYVIDAVTGKSHSVYVKDKILEPLQLKNTFYLPSPAIIDPPPGTSKSYSVSSGSTTFEDVSALQFSTVKNLAGDDGILSEPQDLGKFYGALLDKKTLLTSSSLDEMKKWITISGIPMNELGYGLGLFRIETPLYGEQIGHSGSGLGAAAEAYYFPKYNATVVFIVKKGKFFYTEKKCELREHLYTIINWFF